MISADLSGKRALVTGGASGIGLGTVSMFAQMGATVAINDLPGNPQLDKTVVDLRAEGLEVLAAPADLNDADGTREMVERAAKEMGGLDYLINNAGTPNTKNPIPPSDSTRPRFWFVAWSFSQLSSDMKVIARQMPVNRRKPAQT